MVCLLAYRRASSTEYPKSEDVSGFKGMSRDETCGRNKKG